MKKFKLFYILFYIFIFCSSTQGPNPNELFDSYFNDRINQIKYEKISVFIEVDLSRAKSKNWQFSIVFSWIGPSDLNKIEDFTVIFDTVVLTGNGKQPRRFVGKYPNRGVVSYNAFYAINNGTRALTQNTAYPVSKVKLKNMYIFAQGNALIWYRNCDTKPKHLPNTTEGVVIMGDCN